MLSLAVGVTAPVTRESPGERVISLVIRGRVFEYIRTYRAACGSVLCASVRGNVGGIVCVPASVTVSALLHDEVTPLPPHKKNATVGRSATREGGALGRGARGAGGQTNRRVKRQGRAQRGKY